MANTPKQRLLDLCSESLILTLQLRAAKEFGDPVRLRQRLITLFNRFEQKARDAGFDKEMIKDAQFALVAFVDESILSSTWSGKDAWLANPLQMELFNVFNAGDEFFERLSRLRQRTQANAEVLEVYYHCLELGFSGKYLFIGREKLKPMIDDVYNELRRIHDRPATPLSPHGLPRGEIMQVVKEKVPAWVVGAATAVVGLLFYLIMTYFISDQAGEIREAISKIG